ncbi:hypothetical protein C7S15_1640 [Burkholderia cepacia]|nr:hypothetical protein [Burkholderia cepacia]
MPGLSYVLASANLSVGLIGYPHATAGRMRCIFGRHACRNPDQIERA